MLELIRQYSKRSKTSIPSRNSTTIEKGKKIESQTMKIKTATKNKLQGTKHIKEGEPAVSSNWLAFKTSVASQKMESNPRKPKLENTVKISKHFHKHGKVDTRLDSESKTRLDSKSKKEKKMLANCVALDCEMVGVYDGNESVLARVSIVSHEGDCLYDKYVKPKETVVDYRTHVSGIRPSDLKNAETFEVVQKEVAAILKGKILVGHALKNDLKVLLLSHPPNMIRDTSSFKLFRDISNGRNPSLKKLASEILGITIQSGEHSSVEDARAAMHLYNLYQKEWETLRANRKALQKDTAAGQISTVRPSSAAKTKQNLPNNVLMDEFVAF